MKVNDLYQYFEVISNKMNEKKDELVALDQVFGDGDLGVSMAQGFSALSNYAKNSDETDLSKYFLAISKTFNENAPSSLGTIFSFVFMGMAKYLKGKTFMTMCDFANALKFGMENVMLKTGSKVGDKTMLDALAPVIDFIFESLEKNISDAEILSLVAKEALKGALSSQGMVAKHGRAAYHGEKTIGFIDGGAMAVAYVFEAISEKGAV